MEPTRFFEDLEIGEHAESTPRTVTEDEIVALASYLQGLK